MGRERLSRPSKGDVLIEGARAHISQRALHQMLGYIPNASASTKI